MILVWTVSLTECSIQGDSSLVLWREFIHVSWIPAICKSVTFTKKTLEVEGRNIF